jgi:hypothetical protein
MLRTRFFYALSQDVATRMSRFSGISSACRVPVELSRFGNRCRIKLPGSDLRPVAQENHFRIANHPFGLKHPQSKTDALEMIILEKIDLFAVRRVKPRVPSQTFMNELAGARYLFC